MCSHVAFFLFLLKSCVLLASLVEFFWSVALLRSNFCSTIFVMAEEHIWISAQILHPFKLGTYFQASWPETRQPGVAGAGASSPLALTQGASGASPRRGSHGWGSSCDEDERDSGSRLATPWVSSCSQLPPPPG